MSKDHLVVMRNIKKRFGHIQALNGVDLYLKKDEVLGLVGDNAAGKSTLVKILAGFHKCDEGEIYVDGNSVNFDSPVAARLQGIETIYQDFMLAPRMNLTRNIFLGREVTTMGFMHMLKNREMERRAKGIMKELSFNKSIRNVVANLSGGQQQTVAIGRALLYKPRVVLMDEPTASLSEVAINKFQQLVEELRGKGCAIIYISHRIPNVIQITDRIMVMKAGEVVGERLSNETDLEEVIGMMVGKKETRDKVG